MHSRLAYIENHAPEETGPQKEKKKNTHERKNPQTQGRKRNPNLNFLVRIFSGGVGVFHVNGVGAEKLGMSLETRETKRFWRDIPGFCRDIPAVPEKFEKKKVCVQFSFPTNFTEKGKILARWTFRPRKTKKKLPHHPPLQNPPIRRRHPPGPLAPPVLENPPPPPISIKTDPPPSHARRKCHPPTHTHTHTGRLDRTVGWGSSMRRGGAQKARSLPRKFVPSPLNQRKQIYFLGCTFQAPT